MDTIERTLTIRLLGPIGATGPAGDIDLGGPRQRRLLAALALRAGQRVDTSELIDAMWTDDDLPVEPRETLHTCVSRLRRALGDAALVVGKAGGYALAVDPAHIDAVRFEELASSRGSSTEIPLDRVDRLEVALALWRGPMLAEFEHENWSRPHVVRLTELRYLARDDLGEAYLDADRAAQVVALMEGAAAEQPLRERTHRLLMTALDRCGRTAEALRVAYEFRRRLATDLGLPPGPELVELERLIAAGTEPPSVSSTRSLMGYELQERIGSVAFAGTYRASVDAVPGNLPRQSTSFVGREHELTELAELVRTHDLVTLTGVGGVGKTRLAVKVAAELVPDFADGVWLIELAPIGDPAAVPDAVATALGITPQPGKSVTASVADTLAGRRVLVVFDNCEHVLDATADLIETILARSTTVSVIATSREGLRVGAEHCWPVPSLDVGGGAGSAAVELFIDRARAVIPEFTLNEADALAVTEICRRLDGIALAIELAAARMVSMTPVDVLARLNDRFRLLSGPRRGLGDWCRTGSVVWGGARDRVVVRVIGGCGSRAAFGAAVG